MQSLQIGLIYFSQSDSTGLHWKYRIVFTKYISGIELKMTFEIKLVPKT